MAYSFKFEKIIAAVFKNFMTYFFKIQEFSEFYQAAVLTKFHGILF